MTELDQKAVKEIASLARLALTQKQLSDSARDLTAILKIFSTLDRFSEDLEALQRDEVNEAGELSPGHGLRRDERGDSLKRDLIETMAPDFDDAMFSVPQTVFKGAS